MTGRIASSRRPGFVSKNATAKSAESTGWA
jgi:hypothetical protein